MSLPRSILYPTDFSVPCRAVWPAVQEMARRLNAPVTVVHALDWKRLGIELLPGELERVRVFLKTELDRFPGAASGETALRRELVEGRPASCIVERAATLSEPLIMMPTRGYTRFRQLLLGSVTAAVLHDAACPVWTQAHVESSVPSGAACRSVVCAMDMGAHASTLLRAASEFSSLFGASLHVVHSIPRGDERFANRVSAHAHALLVSNAREKYSAYCENAGAGVPLEIEENFGLTEGVIAAIAKYNADLLIIGRGAIQGTLGRLRTNAHELIRRSPCPVLSI